MKATKPLFDSVFDQRDVADGHRFMRLIEDLKAKVTSEGITHGILLHRWEDASHVRVVVFPGTPAGKEAAEAMLGEGFVEGPFAPPQAEPSLSDMVAKVKSATAQLKMPEGPEPPGKK